MFPPEVLCLLLAKDPRDCERKPAPSSSGDCGTEILLWEMNAGRFFSLVYGMDALNNTTIP